VFIKGLATLLYVLNFNKPDPILTKPVKCIEIVTNGAYWRAWSEFRDLEEIEVYQGHLFTTYVPNVLSVRGCGSFQGGQSRGCHETPAKLLNL
jgi:hypothetical protein